MARTTTTAVETLLGGHYDGWASLTPFVDTATAIVDDIEDNDDDSLLDATKLELIERWLAAHCYHPFDQMAQSEGVGRANASYQGQTGLMLLNSKYGQNALILDITGYLAKLQKQAKDGRQVAGFVWVGTRYDGDDSERTSDQ